MAIRFVHKNNGNPMDSNRIGLRVEDSNSRNIEPKNSCYPTANRTICHTLKDVSMSSWLHEVDVILITTTSTTEPITAQKIATQNSDPTTFKLVKASYLETH
eukprot:122602_1